MVCMATRAHDWDEQGAEDAAGLDHDAFVRAKVAAGLEQSRDRAAMIPIEQAWRDLIVERLPHRLTARSRPSTDQRDTCPTYF